jgi:hypothetical protein
MTLFRSFTPPKRTPNTPKVFIVGLGLALVLHILVFGVYFISQDHHQPIVSLINSGNLKFHDYSMTANSVNLETAVKAYNKRYGRPPPPGFDIWYQFARDRGSKITDEYDQIVEDLKPFWGIEPAVLRERVANAAANKDNDLALIQIRDKRAEVVVAPHWKVIL